MTAGVRKIIPHELRTYRSLAKDKSLRNFLIHEIVFEYKSVHEFLHVVFPLIKLIAARMIWRRQRSKRISA